MQGGLSVLSQGWDRPGARPAVSENGRLGEHVEDVALGPAAPARRAERPVLVPVARPAGLDLEVVVGHVLLYPIAAVLPSVRARAPNRASRGITVICSPLSSAHRIPRGFARRSRARIMSSGATTRSTGTSLEQHPDEELFTPLERRSLLLRKRRANAHGTRITLGDLLAPGGRDSRRTGRRCVSYFVER